MSLWHLPIQKPVQFHLRFSFHHHSKLRHTCQANMVQRKHAMALSTPNSYDFIIIGSGSAGSVLADRLSAQAKHTVLVLEYGGSDRGPLIQMPSALSYPMNMGAYNWG